MSRRQTLWLLPLLVVVLAGAGWWQHRAVAHRATPGHHVYLTLGSDPVRAMDIHYHTLSEGPSVVYYDTEPRPGGRASYRFKAEGHARRLMDRVVHEVTLTKLEPGRTYYFLPGEPAEGYTQEEHFETLPPAPAAIRFVQGGDMGTDTLATSLQVRAAAEDPMFAMIGGDLSYADNTASEAYLWDQWLSNWEQLMRGKDGNLIPMIMGLGNHEVTDGATKQDRAPFFFELFEQGDSYFLRRFDDRLALLVLDTGHITPYDGEQLAWLGKTLSDTDNVACRAAVYHVPLYPAHSNFNAPGCTMGRTLWEPLFDEHHLAAAFEHHDHVFKRTKPILAGKLDPSGVTYFGDGCFGQEPRTVKNGDAWYMEKSASRAHFWMVEVDRGTLDAKAVDAEGAVFDRCTIPPHAQG